MKSDYGRKYKERKGSTLFTFEWNQNNMEHAWRVYQMKKAACIDAINVT